MSFPKKGKIFPTEIDAAQYAVAVANSLRTGLGGSRNAIKTVTGWTGANERTVKNWFSGACGPSGAHLLALIARSDNVLEMVLRLAGREPTMTPTTLTLACEKLVEVIALLRELD